MFQENNFVRTNHKHQSKALTDKVTKKTKLDFDGEKLEEKELDAYKILKELDPKDCIHEPNTNDKKVVKYEATTYAVRFD